MSWLKKTRTMRAAARGVPVKRRASATSGRLRSDVLARTSPMVRSTDAAARRLQERSARMERSALLAQLDATAHPNGGKVTTSWLSLIASEVRLVDYTAQLVVTYGFEGPIESALSYTKGLDTLMQLRARMHSGLAVQDLLALGYTPAQVTALPQCPSITSFEDIAEALGWIYVVERSAFHHESVRRNLIQRLPVARAATSYLAASGATAAQRWQALGRALEEYASTDAIAERVLVAAAHAYRRLRDWKDSNHRRLRSAG